MAESIRVFMLRNVARNVAMCRYILLFDISGKQDRRVKIS